MNNSYTVHVYINACLENVFPVLMAYNNYVCFVYIMCMIDESHIPWTEALGCRTDVDL